MSPRGTQVDLAHTLMKSTIATTIQLDTNTMDRAAEKAMRKELMRDVMEDGTPRFVARQIVGMLMDDDDSGESSASDGIPKDSSDSSDSVPMPSDSSSSDSSKNDDNSVESTKEPAKQRYYGRRNQNESNWYKRYIEDPNTIQKLTNDPTHRDTKEFKGLFRVDYAVFQLLVEL